MKQWVSKLIDQFNFEWTSSEVSKDGSVDLNEERATILYMIDVVNKHLLDVENNPVRKVRERLDAYAKDLVSDNPKTVERALFKFRQFYSRYRIDEYTYILKTFSDFRSIIWDFVEQLSGDLVDEKLDDKDMQDHLDRLREAVEASSIDVLKTESQEFIDSYVEYQSRKESRRSKRLSSVKKNLDVVKKQLVEAHTHMRRDHLTSAFNRKSFDEQIEQHWKLFQIDKVPVTLVMLDIDHFKKVNDTYGHAIGDFVLVELVKILKESYARDADFVARVGGEEFAIILPDYKNEHAVKKGIQLLERIRQEVFVQDGQQIRFTISMGIAEVFEGESIDHWIKRSDAALYFSKNNGRNRLTIASQDLESIEAA